MKRILILAAAVVGFSVAGFATSTAEARPWGPGGHYHGGYGYRGGWARPYGYRYGYRHYAPGVIISTPGFGIGVGTGYGYPAPYPAYGYGYYGW